VYVYFCLCDQQVACFVPAASLCLSNRVLMLPQAAHPLASGALCTSFQPAGVGKGEIFKSCVEMLSGAVADGV
jgi:hypothetical protein